MARMVVYGRKYFAYIDYSKFFIEFFDLYCSLKIYTYMYNPYYYTLKCYIKKLRNYLGCAMQCSLLSYTLVRYTHYFSFKYVLLKIK